MKCVHAIKHRSRTCCSNLIVTIIPHLLVDTSQRLGLFYIEERCCIKCRNLEFNLLNRHIGTVSLPTFYDSLFAARRSLSKSATHAVQRNSQSRDSTHIVKQWDCLMKHSQRNWILPLFYEEIKDKIVSPFPIFMAVPKIFESQSWVSVSVSLLIQCIVQRRLARDLWPTALTNNLSAGHLWHSFHVSQRGIFTLKFKLFLLNTWYQMKNPSFKQIPSGVPCTRGLEDPWCKPFTRDWDLPRGLFSANRFQLQDTDILND